VYTRALRASPNTKRIRPFLFALPKAPKRVHGGVQPTKNSVAVHTNFNGHHAQSIFNHICYVKSRGEQPGIGHSPNNDRGPNGCHGQNLAIGASSGSPSGLRYRAVPPPSDVHLFPVALNVRTGRGLSLSSRASTLGAWLTPRGRGGRRSTPQSRRR